MDISGSKILVTGGAGLIGSHLVDLLVAEGAKVVVYDSLIRGKIEHLEKAEQKGQVELVKADLRDLEAIKEAMQGADYAFHFAAAWLRRCQDQPRFSVDVNIIGTFNLLDACVQAGVKKLVASSSSSVYGEGSYLPTDEEHPFNNDLFYGAAKVANEQHYRCFYKKYGLDFVALRYLNIYGPRQPFMAAYMDVIMHFLNRIDQDLPPIIRGDGTATVDLVFVEDAARANLIALKSEVTNEFFNVASGKETTVRELAETLIRLRGKEGKLEPKYEEMDSGLVTRRCGGAEKAKKMLGFECQVSVEDGLTKVIEWREEVKKRQAACQA